MVEASRAILGATVLAVALTVGFIAFSSTSSEGQSCHTSYTGDCLQPGASDYDCAGGGGNGPLYVQYQVQVVGPDVFDLDRDGNGIGCESLPVMSSAPGPEPDTGPEPEPASDVEGVTNAPDADDLGAFGFGPGDIGGGGGKLVGVIAGLVGAGIA